jgi:uncharacterized membrane protein YgcG
MSILAFVVLAGLGIVVLLTYTKRHRDRDRWPYNLDKSSNTSDTASSDPSWSPTASTLIAAGTLTVLGDDNSPVSTAQPATETSNTVCDTSLSSSDHGATGSWGESSDTSSGGFDSGGSDGGGGSD